MTAAPASAAAPQSWRAPVLAVLAGGMIAGSVDIGAACLINHVGPALILKVIASGLLGGAALHGGEGVIVIGLVLQEVMSLAIAAVFVVGAGLLRWPTSRWIVAGLAYGPVVFLMMNLVVVPLSAAVVKHAPRPSPAAILENLLAMLVFGLIVAGAWAWSQRRVARPG